MISDILPLFLPPLPSFQSDQWLFNKYQCFPQWVQDIIYSVAAFSFILGFLVTGALNKLSQRGAGTVFATLFAVGMVFEVELMIKWIKIVMTLDDTQIPRPVYYSFVSINQAYQLVNSASYKPVGVDSSVQDSTNYRVLNGNGRLMYDVNDATQFIPINDTHELVTSKFATEQFNNLGLSAADFPGDINKKMWVPKYDSPYFFDFRDIDNTTTINYDLTVLLMVGHVLLVFAMLICVVFSGIWARLYSIERWGKRPRNRKKDTLPKKAGIVRLRYLSEPGERRNSEKKKKIKGKSNKIT